jgi:hypothetical protein
MRCGRLNAWVVTGVPQVGQKPRRIGEPLSAVLS